MGEDKRISDHSSRSDPFRILPVRYSSSSKPSLFNFAWLRFDLAVVIAHPLTRTSHRVVLSSQYCCHRHHHHQRLQGSLYSSNPFFWLVVFGMERPRKNFNLWDSDVPLVSLIACTLLLFVSVLFSIQSRLASWSVARLSSFSSSLSLFV